MDALYTAFQGFFGDSTYISDMTDFMKLMVNIVTEITTDKNVGSWLSMFCGGAVSLLILYFYIELSSQASADLLTFEKLVVNFMKLIVAVSILVCLKPILVNIVGLFAKVFYLLDDKAKNGGWTGHSDSSITYFGKDTFISLPQGEKIKKLNDGKSSNYGDGDKAYWKHVYTEIDKYFYEDVGFIEKAGAMIMAFMVQVLQLISKITVFLFLISNAVTLVARLIFSPIAIANLFDGGARSSGVRYIKKLAASMLTFAVIVGMLWAVQQVQAAVVIHAMTKAGFSDLNGKAMAYFFSSGIGNLAAIMAAQAVMIAGSAKASQIANDVLGVG